MRLTSSSPHPSLGTEINPWKISSKRIGCYSCFVCLPPLPSCHLSLSPYFCLSLLSLCLCCLSLSLHFHSLRLSISVSLYFCLSLSRLPLCLSLSLCLSFPREDTQLQWESSENFLGSWEPWCTQLPLLTLRWGSSQEIVSSLVHNSNPEAWAHGHHRKRYSICRKSSSGISVKVCFYPHNQGEKRKSTPPVSPKPLKVNYFFGSRPCLITWRNQIHPLDHILLSVISCLEINTGLSIPLAKKNNEKKKKKAVFLRGRVAVWFRIEMRRCLCYHLPLLVRFSVIYLPVPIFTRDRNVILNSVFNSHFCQWWLTKPCHQSLQAFHFVLW